MRRFLVIFLIVCLPCLGQEQAETARGDNVLGMYIHQHWSYQHPYAARTWTLEDWRGYLEGISQLGYNMILIWPMLETMPNPLTPSDRENIEKIARVIEMAHQAYGMKVNLVLCPNVSSKDEIARKYAFVERPFFTTDDRIDPADPVELGRLVSWREELLRPLAAVDGIFIIDSDPGGFPHSTNLDFVYLLKAHRKMLDRLRPGIELVYWTHFGWEAYGRFYATGELKRGQQDEPREAIMLLSKQNVEPWSVASSGFSADLADPIGMNNRVLGFPYGTIEKEPSFPFTLFDYQRAYEGGKRKGARGVLGNSQTHVVQLPNTFAFARGAQSLPLERQDYVAFAEGLIPGNGDLIVRAWEALQSDNMDWMNASVSELVQLRETGVREGPLGGLMLGGATRFVEDLILQLKAGAGMANFWKVMAEESPSRQVVVEAYSDFVEAITAWHARHGYGGNWRWPKMYEALVRLNHPKINAVVETLVIVSKEGATPFERVKRGLAELESYSNRLLTVLQDVRAEMETELAQNQAN